MHYQFNNSVNKLVFGNILLFLTFCCLQCSQNNFYLNKNINLGVDFVNIINKNKYIFGKYHVDKQ